MGVLDELSNEQKYAISQIIDGTVTLIENLTYSPNSAETIAAAIYILIREKDWCLSLDEVIEELKKYKEEQP